MWIKGAKNEIHKKDLKKIKKRKEKIKKIQKTKTKKNQTILSDKNWKFNLTYFLL